MLDEFGAVLRAAQAGDEGAIATLWNSLNHRLARFLAVRAGGATLDVVAASDDPAGEAIEAFDTRAALAVIARLPQDQAEVILLRVLGGLDVERVARIVGKKPGNVRMLQHRGLRRLREMSEVADRAGEGVTR